MHTQISKPKHMAHKQTQMHKPIPKSQSLNIRPINKHTSPISTTITIKIKEKKNLHNFKFWKDEKVEEMEE